MRRVFAISLAIAAVTFMAGGVMAQETQQDGNGLLLKILKERNILTDQEFQEIKGQLAQEKSEVDQQLSALDRSLADYLAKAGDSVGGNSTYVQNQGVTFTAGDGNWSVYFGGLIQFGYMYSTSDVANADPTGGFGVEENRIDFGGTIFDPNMSFYVQLQPGDSPSVLDVYVDWAYDDMTSVRAGQFKVPFGRQSLVDESDRAFGALMWVGDEFRVGTAGRDVGVMFHGTYLADGNPDGMAFEYAAGIWNGSGNHASEPVNGADHELMWGLRGGFYPMGMLPYVEGDFECSPDPKFGIAGSFLVDQTHGSAPDDDPVTTSFEVDGVFAMGGIYFTGEYFNRKFEPAAGSDVTDKGWYLQGGYFVMPGEVELIGYYGMVQPESDDDVSYWALGGAYYLNGHEWKVVGAIGQQITDFAAAGADDEKIWFVRLGLQADW